ncbi:probable nuclear hormone receptor HR38 isoform X1 [Varroa jacobsoni]|uniref:probable nuclear hormone receptor HR38 isoform X1 n=1 Tax=Varroa jacobsoni TaxID=62625 RepID=UPI000BF51262|nr:probable nuclear hormone receptor HR38 isoform X1 [Varroa jacobsoni]XP_022702962.1 probable nuclear hormone receptor HR38 isoform X1 [Varroa jacobsoni]
MLQMDDFSCRLRMGSPLVGGATVGIAPMGVSLQLGSAASAFHATSSSPPEGGCSSASPQHSSGNLPTVLITAANVEPFRLKAHAIQHASAFFATAPAASANGALANLQGDPPSAAVADSSLPASLSLSMRTNELSHESLVSDPALREEVSAVQLELQRQILALQHEQHLQQQILLQHFQLQQKHLQQQHDQQLADRIRLYMESQRLRSDNSSHSDEDRDSGNGSDKDVSNTQRGQELNDKEAPDMGTPSPPVIKCPKKDVLRKLEEEEKLRLARESAAATPPAASPPVPNRSPGLPSSPKKSSPSGASAEVRLKLQQFLARRQEQRASVWSSEESIQGTSTKGSSVSQRDRQASSSSEGSSTSSHVGSESESPPVTALREGSPPPNKNATAANDLTLKVKSALRQKFLEGRTSPISKNDKARNKMHNSQALRADESQQRLEENDSRSGGCSQELPKQKRNMYHMISLLLGQQQTVPPTPASGGP